MKDEKEAERQVCGRQCASRSFADYTSATDRGDSHQTRSKGGTGTLPEDGGEDAQEARGTFEEEREAEQDAEIMSAA